MGHCEYLLLPKERAYGGDAWIMLVVDQHTTILQR